MLAVPELDLRPMPAAMSGYQESAAGLDEERDTWRRWGAAAVLLLGLIVVIFAVVRGLAAVRQARALLSATDEEQAPRGRRVKAVLVVFGIALLAGLAFVGTALVVLARGL